MNAQPSIEVEAMSESELLATLVEMINSGDIQAELRADGQMGWMPGPRNENEMVRICTICGGSGFLSDNIAALITADFRLTNLCPDCSGTGIIEDGQPLESDPLPETPLLPGRDLDFPDVESDESIRGLDTRGWGAS